MWNTPESAHRTSLCLMELMGKLTLANVDAAQRMQYLVARLTVGAADNCLRTHVLQRGDLFYASDRAVLEKRVSLMVEAGAEGCVTIVRGLIEESTQAQICCMEDLFGLKAGRPSTLQLSFSPGVTLPFAGVASFSARE
ncbi:hypothetical protein [Zoogloea sp.]|uniref:hypothetical protein n=1 Tax=Zoogloea sp. TaxID=49181 RepID=UPI001A367141|nr:hypothetical protein [Zoogloea sp.]